MLTLLLEVVGALLVAVGAGLFDVRLALVVVGLYLIYAARGDR